MFQKLGVESFSGKLVIVTLYLWIPVSWSGLVVRRGCRRNSLSMWEATLTANPTSFAANNNLQLFCDGEGRIQQALELLRKASKLAPNSTSHILTWVKCVDLRATDAEQKNVCQDDINPISTPPSCSRKYCCESAGQKDEAIEFLKNPMKRNPRSGNFTANSACSTIFKVGRELPEELRVGRKLDPFSTRVHSERRDSSVKTSRQGDPSSETALSLAPHVALTRMILLGVLCTKR